jgi:hypothetical protein
MVYGRYFSGMAAGRGARDCHVIFSIWLSPCSVLRFNSPNLAFPFSILQVPPFLILAEVNKIGSPVSTVPPILFAVLHSGKMPARAGTGESHSGSSARAACGPEQRRSQ